jgi:AcrR family transcriptional regulator
MEPEEVALHQRARLHGAMIEAVARNGYERTSVKQVIGLAGVSRRSFYELFENKHDCFLATFDVLAGREIKRIRNSYVEAHGGLDERLQAVFAHCAETVWGDQNAVRLVLLDVASSGPDGLMRFCRAAAELEQLLSLSFEASSSTSALPPPVVRAILGSLHWSVAAAIRDETLAEPTALAEEMLEWVLRFRSPAQSTWHEDLQRRTRERARKLAAASSPAAARRRCVDVRSQLMQSVLQLGAQRQRGELSAPLIADRASVTLDDFFAEFKTTQHCLEAALEMTGQELLGVAREASAGENGWAQRSMLVCEAVLAHLASNPLHARALVLDVNTAGRAALARHHELSHELANLLTEQAPHSDLGFAGEGLVGALWHTIRCQVTSGRVPMLAALSDQLAFAWLAPYLGAEQAAGEVLSRPL